MSSLSIPLDLYADAQCAIFVIDAKASILWLNNSAASLTGYSKQELIGHRMLDLARPFPWTRDATHCSGAASPLSFRSVLFARDGTGIDVEVFARPVDWAGQAEAMLVRTRDIRKECALRDRLRSEVRRAILAKQQERRRLARIVHDEILAGLLDLAAVIGGLDSDSSEQPVSQEDVRLLRQHLASSVDSMRLVACRLREDPVDDLDLVTALRDMTRYETTRTPSIHLSITGDHFTLPKESNYLILGVAQEALRNAERHSHASNVLVNLTFSEDHLVLEISDNGIGFSPPTNEHAARASGSLGLVGLLERASLLGGTLTINSQALVGTTVRLMVPKFYVLCEEPYRQLDQPTIP